ncbi:MAG TPA: fasciclin domain-containing protein [Candidatus Binataceae bacterium]|nr:fasciclin domain-containing protein [Candidatus Binataceae bacterium]
MEYSKNTAASASGSTARTSPLKDIVDTAIAAGTFGTLLAGVKAAGLTDTLKGKGPFTVFAPTDEAFKNLPVGSLDALLKDTTRLKAILSYHVVAGYHEAKDVKSGELMTLQGSSLTAAVSSTEMRVNGARVKQTDIAATNGVIHVIDAVIIPKNWQLLAAAA